MVDSLITSDEISKAISMTATAAERSLLSLAWDLGASMHIIRALRVSDVDLNQSTAIVTLPKGKFPLSQATADAVRKYVDDAGLSRGELLFPAKGNWAAHERRLQRIIEQVGNRAGIKKLTLKSIRKARAATLVSTQPVHYVARLFGISYQAAALYYGDLTINQAPKPAEDALFGLLLEKDGSFTFAPAMQRVRKALLRTGNWKANLLDAVLLSPSPRAAHLRRLLSSAMALDDSTKQKRRRRLLDGIIELPEVQELFGRDLAKD